MRAIYDLSKFPTTFDFATWACIAKTEGATSAHFIVDEGMASWKYPEELGWKRWANILLPICKLAGLTFTVGSRVAGSQHSYMIRELIQLYKNNGSIEKLKPTLKAEDSGYVTITLRESFRNTYRNSNYEAWMRFRDHLRGRGKRVIVLPECERAPIDIEERMALYCGAEMNFGVANGPMALCIFSEAPYLTINWYEDKVGDAQYDQKRLMEKQGFPVGSQYPWRSEKQTLVYSGDSFEEILAAYEGEALKVAA